MALKMVSSSNHVIERRSLGEKFEKMLTGISYREKGEALEQTESIHVASCTIAKSTDGYCGTVGFSTILSCFENIWIWLALNLF